MVESLHQLIKNKNKFYLKIPTVANLSKEYTRLKWLSLSQKESKNSLRFLKKSKKYKINGKFLTDLGVLSNSKITIKILPFR